MSSRKAYVASVSRYFNGERGKVGEEERVQKRAERWRRQAVKRIEEAGLGERKEHQWIRQSDTQRTKRKRHP
jgi:hypothetical protein